MEADEAPKKPEPKHEKKQETKEEAVASEKKQADHEKDLGNAAYKNKEFEKALEHYHLAHQLDPEKILFILQIVPLFYLKWERIKKQLRNVNKL